MVWGRLKRLLGSGEDAPTVDEAEGVEAPSAQPPEPPDPTREALAGIDGALRQGDAQTALARMRAILLVAPGDRRVLERAAHVLARVDERDLGEGFARAAQSRDAATLIQLSEAFLELDDPEIAYSLATAAVARDKHGPGPAEAVARALSVLGDFEAVIEQLDRFIGRWPNLELARLYGAAVVQVGAWERWDDVAEALAGDAEGAWLVAAAERARSFPPDEDTDPIQHQIFVRYGAALLDPEEGVQEVDAERLGAWIAGAAALLLGRLDADARLAYLGPKSEVIARWLAESLGRTAIPLSARLPQQALVVVAADDDDLEPLYQTRAFFGAPSLLVQAIKDPTRHGVPMADVIGLLSDAATLPLGALDVERAAERVPPKLLVRDLREAAGRADELAVAGLLAWYEERRGYLSLDAPCEPEDRASYSGW